MANEYTYGGDMSCIYLNQDGSRWRIPGDSVKVLGPGGYEATHQVAFYEAFGNHAAIYVKVRGKLIRALAHDRDEVTGLAILDFTVEPWLSLWQETGIPAGTRFKPVGRSYNTQNLTSPGKPWIKGQSGGGHLTKQKG